MGYRDPTDDERWWRKHDLILEDILHEEEKKSPYDAAIYCLKHIKSYSRLPVYVTLYANKAEEYLIAAEKGYVKKAQTTQEKIYRCRNMADAYATLMKVQKENGIPFEISLKKAKEYEQKVAKYEHKKGFYHGILDIIKKLKNEWSCFFQKKTAVL